MWNGDDSTWKYLHIKDFMHLLILLKYESLLEIGPAIFLVGNSYNLLKNPVFRLVMTWKVVKLRLGNDEPVKQE